MKKNNLIIPILLFSMAFVQSCSTLSKSQKLMNKNFPEFSYEGHRGARGLYPENTIGAMKTAIDLPKVTTLELDCHITKDGKVIVYHDAFLNDKFVQYTDGSPLTEEDKKRPIYDFTYDELQKYDIGSKLYKDFPDQKKENTQINLLSDLIDAAEEYAKEKRDQPMYYNIEVKSKKGKEDEYHPKVDHFADLMLSVIIEKNIGNRTVIQSFDEDALRHVNEVYPQIKTSYLISGNNKKSISENIETLGFTPFIISPNYQIVNEDFVNDAHKKHIKIVPWTVNDKEKINELIEMNVDGIITDYPNLF